MKVWLLEMFDENGKDARQVSIEGVFASVPAMSKWVGENHKDARRYKGESVAWDIYLDDKDTGFVLVATEYGVIE